jgi:hypothetical protein
MQTKRKPKSKTTVVGKTIVRVSHIPRSRAAMLSDRMAATGESVIVIDVAPNEAACCDDDDDEEEEEKEDEAEESCSER